MAVNKDALAALCCMCSAVQHLMDASRGGYKQQLADITVDIAGVRAALCECDAGNPRELFREKKIYGRLCDFMAHNSSPPRLRFLLQSIRETMIAFDFQ